MSDSLAFVFPIEARETTPCIYIWFVIVRDHIPLSVLSCPFGAMDLWGAFATQGGASRLRRDALPWANLLLPLRGVRTIAPRGPGAEGVVQPRRIAMPQSGCHAPTGPAIPRRNGPASRNRRALKGQNRLVAPSQSRKRTIEASILFSGIPPRYEWRDRLAYSPMYRLSNYSCLRIGCDRTPTLPAAPTARLWCWGFRSSSDRARPPFATIEPGS